MTMSLNDRRLWPRGKVFPDQDADSKKEELFPGSVAFGLAWGLAWGDGNRGVMCKRERGKRKGKEKKERVEARPRSRIDGRMGSVGRWFGREVDGACVGSQGWAWAWAGVRERRRPLGQ